MKLNRQQAKIIAYLKLHRELTVFEAVVKLHITSIHRRFTELREGGYNIQGRWRKNENGRFKAYWLAS